MSIGFKDIVKVSLLTSIIFIVIQFLNVLLGTTIHFNLNLLINFAYTALYTFSLFFTNSYLFQKLDHIFSEDRFSRKRVFIGFLSSFIISLAVIFLLRIFEDVIINRTPFKVFLAKETASNYIVSVVITFFCYVVAVCVLFL